MDQTHIAEVAWLFLIMVLAGIVVFGFRMIILAVRDEMAPLGASEYLPIDDFEHRATIADEELKVLEQLTT